MAERQNRASRGEGEACSRQCVLALDYGTSGIKSALITREGDIVPLGKLDEPEIPPSGPDAQEWSPANSIGNLAESIFRAGCEARMRGLVIKALALTATTSSLVAMRDGVILPSPAAIRWDDLRSRPQAKRLERVRKKHQGFPWLQPVGADAGIAKALFLVESAPRILKVSHVRLKEQWSLFNSWLTDEDVQAENICARKWGHTAKRPWSPELKAGITTEFGKKLGKARAPGWLEENVLAPRIVCAGEPIGPMRRGVALDLDLSEAPLVVGTPFDTFAQTVGLGLAGPSDVLGISLGTSLGVCRVIDEDDFDGSWGRLGPVPACPVPGSMTVFDGVASCGAAINYFCRRFGIIKGDHPDWDRVAAALRRSEPGAHGVSMLPYFAGGRRTTLAKPHVGSIRGVTVATEEEDFIRALFESFAYLIKLIMDDMENRLGCPSEIRVGGGLVRCCEFLSILAGVTGRELSVCSFPDAGLLGLGACAFKGLGWADSVQEAVQMILAPEGKRASVSIGQRAHLFRVSPGQDRSAYEGFYEAFLSNHKLK